MTHPLVTVLLPVYNSARFLRQAIDSVLAQTLGDLELLIIEDGSTDGSAAIIGSYADPRVRLISNPGNIGLIRSLNRGIDLARGRYIARMDGDDIMLPRRLELQVRTMTADEGIAVLATTVELINTDGDRCGTWDTDRNTLTEAAITAMLPRTNCIAHPSVMIRRSALGPLRYASGQDGAEDWDLWLRMRSRGLRIAKLEETLLLYRVHPDSIMAGSKRKVPLERRLLRTRWRYLRRELGRFRFGPFHLRVVVAQLRTGARWALKIATGSARDLKRLFTWSPFVVLAEYRALRNALDAWNGSHLFLFPYLNTGGAEKVHGDILAAVADRAPLAIICGRSRDRGNAGRFQEHATVIEAPHALNHPFTRRMAERRIAGRLNAARAPVLFSSLTTTFFELQPLLAPHVGRIWLQHAFLYQPEGNRQHREWVAYFNAVHRYCFVSRHALEQFRSFLFAQGIPRSAMGKLQFIPNAVDRCAAPVRRGGPVGVLFVGRDSAEKRPELFIRLCERLHAARPGAFSFTAVGLGAMKNTAGIRFTGRLEDSGLLSSTYAANDILVLTSDREGFPMVIMEAMAHGLAIVSTPVGDVPDRCDPAFAIVTGTTDAEGTLAECTKALLGLADDPDRLWAMRSAAHERALGDFSLAAFRERYRDLLISPDASNAATAR